MKSLRCLPVVVLLLLAACQEGYEPGEDARPGDAAVATAERDAFIADVDQRLAAADEKISTFESQLVTLPEDARAKAEGELASIAEERRDIVTLRDEAMQASTYEELSEAQRKIREEFRDIDQLLTEARLDVIEAYPAFRTTVEAEMAELQTELREMDAEAPRLDDTTRARYDSLRTEIEQRTEALGTRLAETTEETWQNARTEISEEWQAIKRSYYELPRPDVHADAERPAEQG